ncbi:hypothetical protein FACS1894201_11900 [Bacteroidia bacterium]|nr:hypothetical protein FACS1894201_11900 [Bacteroidia bacterium]
MKVDVTPNDPRFASQWGLLNMTNFVDISMMSVWDNYTTGDSNVIVAIIDNTVDTSHPDLIPNLWINRGEIPNNGLDDDNNGYIDDVYGWDFRNESCRISVDEPGLVTLDDAAHGTHVAGIVAARTNNGTGVAGVAGGWGDRQGSRLMVFRCGYLDLGEKETYITEGYRAMVYAADNGAAIAQCSWGGEGSSSAGTTAINYFNNHGGGQVMRGGLVCAAAGNENSATKHFPAANSKVLSVASLTTTGDRSSFSNYGTWVSVCAPGSSIMSTYPWAGSKYGNMSGTSMATPMVSGVDIFLQMLYGIHSGKHGKCVFRRTGKAKSPRSGV